MPVEWGAADTVLDARGANFDPTWSPDGRELAYHAELEGQDDIWRVALEEAGAGPVTSNREDDQEPDWSPAVNRICYTGVKNGNADIWIMDSSGIEFQNVTNHPARDHTPRWTPDGREILFVSDRDGNDEIYVVALTGEEPRRLTNDSGSDDCPTMTPDGWVVFQSSREQSVALWRVRLEGGLATRLTKPESAGDWDGRPAASPTPGGGVFFTRALGDDRDLYTVSLDGSPPRALLQNPLGQEDQASVSADGMRVAFQSGGNFDLWIVDVPPEAQASR
jgi:TolB protein